MPRPPTYSNEEERNAARRVSKMQWYHKNRDSQLIKMRARYDKKVAVPQDRDRRQQGPRPAPPTQQPDHKLVQRSIHRIRQLDDLLRGASNDGNLRTYAEELYHDFCGREREDALLMLIDLESDLSRQVDTIEVGAESIRHEVGIADPVWKEAIVIRERFAHILEYVEDMRQWAEKRKLKVRYKQRQLLFQQCAA